jgi:hypothetical protein
MGEISLFVRVVGVSGEVGEDSICEMLLKYGVNIDWMFLRYFCWKYLPNVFHQLADILHGTSQTFFTKYFGNMNHEYTPNKAKFQYPWKPK